MMTTGMVLDHLYPDQAPGPTASLFTTAALAIIIFGWHVKMTQGGRQKVEPAQ